MDLYDWYYKQVVVPGELANAFEAADKSLRGMVTTLGIFGLAVGGEVVPTTPTPGLSVIVQGPVLGYDDEGNRIYLEDANLAVNLSVDENGAATTIFTPGQERYLGIFIKFARLLSDPRTDGDGNEVMFARLESAEVVVAAGAPAPVGAASRAALRDGHVLLADVRLTTGQTQVQAAHILTDRTEYIFRAGTGPDAIFGRNFGEIVAKLFVRVYELIDYVKGLLIDTAAKLPFVPAAGVSATNVQAAIEEVASGVPSIPPASGISFPAAAAWSPPAAPNVEGAILAVRTTALAAAQDAINALSELDDLGATERDWTVKQTFVNAEANTLRVGDGYAYNNWGVFRDINFVNTSGVVTPQAEVRWLPLESAHCNEGGELNADGWQFPISPDIYVLRFPINLGLDEQLTYIGPVFSWDSGPSTTAWVRASVMRRTYGVGGVPVWKTVQSLEVIPLGTSTSGQLHAGAADQYSLFFDNSTPIFGGARNDTIFMPAHKYQLEIDIRPVDSMITMRGVQALVQVKGPR